MKTFDNLRRKIGSILGVAIPEKGFESVVLSRDTQGAVGHKQLIRIMIALYNYLEEQSDAKTAPQPTTANQTAIKAGDSSGGQPITTTTS